MFRIFFLFRPANDDYTSDSLQMVKDKIYINLFDEVVIDMLAVRFSLYIHSFPFSFIKNEFQTGCAFHTFFKKSSMLLT